MSTSPFPSATSSSANAKPATAAATARGRAGDRTDGRTTGDVTNQRFRESLRSQTDAKDAAGTMTANGEVSTLNGLDTTDDALAFAAFQAMHIPATRGEGLPIPPDDAELSASAFGLPLGTDAVAAFGVKATPPVDDLQPIPINSLPTLSGFVANVPTSTSTFVATATATDSSSATAGLNAFAPAAGTTATIAFPAEQGGAVTSSLADTPSATAGREAVILNPTGESGNPNAATNDAAVDARATSNVPPRPSTAGQSAAPAAPAAEAVSSTESADDAPVFHANKPVSAVDTFDAPAPDDVAVANVPMRAEGNPASPTTALPAEPEPLVGRDNADRITAAAKEVTAFSGGGRQSMTVRLDPPQLGSVRVHIQVVDGAATATIATSNDTAHALVRGSLEQLQQSLDRSGVSIDRIQVTRMGGPEAAAGTREHDGQSQQQQGGQNEARDQQQHQQREQARRDALLRFWNRGGFDSQAA